MAFIQPRKCVKRWAALLTISVATLTAANAQTAEPKGLYKLSEIIHQDGKHLEAPFKQYKYCMDDLTLMFAYNEPIWINTPFEFLISNPDGKPLRLTGELSKTEDKGIQVIGTSDSTFTLRWFNNRGAFNEHLFPSGTNIDEVYSLVKDSTDNIRKALDVLQMKPGEKVHRLQGMWKLRGQQQTNTATSQYWIQPGGDGVYEIFGSKGVVMFTANAKFPQANLQCRYIPCTYLSENAFDNSGHTSIVNWFDENTISVTAISGNGHPYVTVWDRCGLPQNIQQVFGTNVPMMTKDVSRFTINGFEKMYGNQPDSIRKAFETFDFAVDANEHNNAIFPVLMRCGFEGEYKAMKDSLLAQLMRGEMNSEEAVCRYILWFNKNFDRHTNCSSPLFWEMQKDVIMDYTKIIPKYAPEPLGCKVDDETYLLRLPSCMGEVPTDEWLLKKKEEFMNSGCKYLILDLRGNGGGSDHMSLLFTSLMTEGVRAEDMKAWYMVSTENNRRLKQYCEKMPGGYHENVFAEATTTEEGKLINWFTIPKGSDEHKSEVRRGAIIVDNYTASAGESPVRWIRSYPKSKVKVYGRERTNGCDQTGNVNDIYLPNINMKIRFPMTVDDVFETMCKEKNPGHKPDVIIPLPYPEQLTDNIDSWVLWVAKKLKK